MVGGWAGALGGGDGINVVAGTGSIAYGERRGLAHRAGGWSELFGDEGSAYWVAVQGLNAFSRMSDGRLPRGPLHALLAERVGITSDLDLVGVVVDHWGGRRAEIAALSKVVTEAARSPATPWPPGSCGRRAAKLVALVEACRNGIRIPRRRAGGRLLLGRHVLRAVLPRRLRRRPGRGRFPDTGFARRCTAPAWARRSTP